MATRYQRQVMPDVRGDGGGVESLSIADALTRFDEKVRPTIDTLQFNQQAPEIRQNIAEGGDFQPNLGITPLQKARNEVAQRAYLDRTKLDIQAEFANLSTKYQGHAPDDAENFARELDAYAQPKLSGIPDQFRGSAEQLFAEERGRAVAGLKERAATQAFQNDIRDIKAAAMSDAESLMKAARDGDGGAIERATASIHGRYSDLVTKGVMGEEEAIAEAGKLVEGVRAESLYGAFIRGGGPSLEDVQAGRGEAANLSLDARDALARQMQAEMAHRRSEQNHAIAMQGKATSQGDRDLNALSRKMDLGVPLTPEEQARLTGYSAGALPASPLQVAEARASSAGLVMARNVATATPEQLAAARAEWAMTPPASIEEALIRQKASAALDAREKGLKDDPASYASTVLPDKFPPVVLPTNPALPEFDAALRQLSDNADGIRAQFGVQGSPLTKAQAFQVSQSLAQLPPAARAEVRGKIEANMGANAALVWEDIAKQDAFAMAHAGIVSSQGRPDLASAIDAGSEALKLKAVGGLDPKKAQVALFSAGIHAAFPTSPKAQAQLMEAASALAASRAVNSGSPEVTPEMMQEALAELQPVGKYRDRTVALPLGVTDAGDFADRVESVTDTEIARMGGDVGHLGGIADALRGGQARLESLGEGRYFVTIGTVRATNADGSPFVLDYSGIAPKQRTAPLSLDLSSYEAVGGSGAR